MWKNIKSWFSWSKIWNIAGVVALLLSFASIMSYFGGITANWGVITFAIAGLWLYQRFGSPVAKTVGSVTWYIAAFTVYLLTAFTFGSSTLLGMYDNWADYSRSIWGFIRIFAPIISLIIGSIMIASVATTPKALTKKLTVFCMILVCFGLFLYELVEPFDKWMATEKLEQAQSLNKNRLATAKGLGMVAEIIGENIKVYQNIGDKRYFDEYPSFKANRGMPLPLVNGLGEVLNDGPHKMVQVYLPDKNGQFTGRSETAWVRLDDVSVKNKPLLEKGFDDQPLENGNVRKITFTGDERCVVLESWPKGKTIVISGFGKDTVYFQDGNREAMVPESGIITSGINHPLEMRYRKGGILYISM